MRCLALTTAKHCISLWAIRLRQAFRSNDAFLAYIRTQGNASGAHSWTNEDLKPSPPHMVNWQWYHFCLFWFGVGFGNWTLGSSIVGAGLTSWQAIIVVWVAAGVSGLCMAFNSRAAANYHVGYPVVLRTSFGMYGHYWPVIARGACAMLWVSVLNFQGGAFVSTMLRCIVGHRWDNLGAQFPPPVGTTLQRFLGFLIFWAVELPFCSLRPNRLRWLYTLKAWLLPPSVIGLLIYCVVQSRGRLASDADLSNVAARPTGSALVWVIVAAINSAMGNWSTFIANMPDFARYATDPSATMWTHIVFVPFPAAIGGMIGIFGTSCLQKAWSVTLWNQWDVYDAILEHSWTGPARLGVFLLAFSSALFNFGVILGANLLPFASDITALFPTYFNLTRGMCFCCIISLTLMPWKILASAHGFLAFLNGYGIFMGPTAAIMITDYWIVRKGNIHVNDAYSSEPGSRYMYKRGINPNAAMAYVAGMMIPVVGFIGTFGVAVPRGAARCDDIGWYVSSVVSGVSYLALCRLRPLANVDASMGREVLAREFASEREAVDQVEGAMGHIIEEEVGKKGKEEVEVYCRTLDV
ncbi:permease for cytosine/purines, uracil, thiamine, allantoin-domain-containing protein [Dichomitus squalens]|uniref:Permease for cytosine/purines, uracil, thiamine, allantoin-domain-containing protein n=1 Tax=Dichomitus squalens TaxID=114155 RepID=A0A4Q9PIY4_9APHY|nr:permease for cytosine/purines, uracil, thiamine, allantoin-domain-containing protein [Dichomitus squalens]